MAIINIHPSLTRFTNNQNQIELTIKSAGDLIESLCQAHPKLRSTILDTNGELTPYVNIYINSKSIKQHAPDFELNPSDQINIMTALVGG